MKKILVILGIICFLQFSACNDVFAFTGGHSTVPGMKITTVSGGNGVSTTTISRPVVYLGGGAKRRPPYYKECRKKLGYWDEQICAQYYLPRMFAKWDEQN